MAIDNGAKVIAWLKLQTQSVEGCVSLLKRFVGRSSSQAIGDYVAKITTYIKLENIEEFLEIGPIEEKVRELDETNLDSESQEALRAFRMALDNRAKGITDDW